MWSGQGRDRDAPHRPDDRHGDEQRLGAPPEAIRLVPFATPVGASSSSGPRHRGRTGSDVSSSGSPDLKLDQGAVVTLAAGAPEIGVPHQNVHAGMYPRRPVLDLSRAGT